MGFAVFGKAFFRLWLPALSAAEINQIQILSVLTFLPQMISIYAFPLYQINVLTCRVRLPAVLDCAIGAVNIAVVYLLLRFTSLGIYAVAGVSSVLLIVKILIFVPIYAADGIKVGRKTFYPYIFRGICMNAVLLCNFFRYKQIFCCVLLGGAYSGGGSCSTARICSGIFCDFHR